MADLTEKTSPDTMDRRSFTKKLGLGALGLFSAPNLFGGGKEPTAKIPDTATTAAPLPTIAAPYPPQNFGQIIALEDVQSSLPVTLTDPPSGGGLGDKNSPILITYGATITPDRVQIDNDTGVLKLDGVTLVSWPTPKERSTVARENRGRNWMKDDVGPHVHIAPVKEDGTQDLDKIIPVTVPATRDHWLHSSHVYTKAEQITPFLKEPAAGKYFRLRPPPGQEEMLKPVKNTNTRKLAPKDWGFEKRLDYRQWSYETGTKTAYNILHWQPDQKSFKPQTENIFALNLAMLESSWQDTPGCNPFITNPHNYMGLFQFGLEALGAHKKMMRGKQWQGIEINGDAIKNNASFLNNWQAQMAAFQYHAYSLAEQMDKALRTNRNKKHMKGVSLVGLMAAAHLRGPGPAKQYAESGKATGDGTGTLNSFYAHKYGVLTDANFHHGYDITQTWDTQKVLDDMIGNKQGFDAVDTPKSAQSLKNIMPIDNTRTPQQPPPNGWIDKIKAGKLQDLGKGLK